MEEDLSPFIRTDFSDNVAWEDLVLTANAENEMGFQAQIRPVDDRKFENAEPLAVARYLPDALVFFVVDKRALKTSEILCIDGVDPGKTLRVRAEDLWIVENNVSVGNMLFEELLEQVDEKGVLAAE